ncbi:hypothetical protein DSUL_60291 [Desulfovibrionales bacterium]
MIGQSLCRVLGIGAYLLYRHVDIDSLSLGKGLLYKIFFG